MPTNFSVILTSRVRPLPEAWRLLHESLNNAGFVAASAVYRLERDGGGAFELVDRDEVQGDAEIDRIQDDDRFSKALGSWAGVFLQYARQDITLGAGCALGKDHTNYFVRCSTRLLAKLFELDDAQRPYRILVSIAETVEAAAGFGERDLDFLDVNISQSVESIVSNPENPDYPCSLGVLPLKAFDQSEVNRRADNLFSVSRIGDAYYVLEERDYLDVFRSAQS